MTRLSLFNSPLLLGFDHFERTLDRIAKAGAEGYPPYNIEQIGEDRLRITLAVAGFGLDDLEIQIEDNQLTIKGRQKDDPDRVYLYRGIAARQFQRSFVLAEGIDVNRRRRSITACYRSICSGRRRSARCAPCRSARRAARRAAAKRVDGGRGAASERAGIWTRRRAGVDPKVKEWNMTKSNAFAL